MDASRLARAYRAAEEIPPGAAVKAHATRAGYVVKAAAATDKILGVAAWEHERPTPAEGIVDVCVGGWTRVALGSGAVAPGDLLTSDAGGKAAVAAAGNRVFGVAQEAAAAASGGYLEILIAHATA